MKVCCRLFLSLAVLLIIYPQPVFARVFNLASESFASYLVGTSSQANLRDTPMAGESAIIDSYNTHYSKATGGEFGFAYISGKVGFRFGFEVLKPPTLEGDAKDGTGAKRFNYINSMLVMTPKIGMDINLITRSWFRFGVYGFWGSAGLSSTTEYSRLSNIAPNASHTVEMRSTAPTYGGGLTSEIALFDTTTLVLEAGYRQLKFTNIKYATDVTTFEGAVVKGDAVENYDGTDRNIDFTGAYFGAGFRFYLF